MKKSDTFILILHSKTIHIPSNFRTLEDVDLNIYQSLITNHQYEVKSHVSESVLESFIDNWIYQSIPKINLGNFSQYEELSHEFDRMNDIIELYQINIQNQIISKFKRKIQLIMEKIQKLNIIIHQQIKQHQKIIEFIFGDTNYYKIMSNTSFKNELFQIFLIENNKFFELISITKIERNDIIFNLDKITKTASIYSNKSNAESIFIPKSVFYENDEYLIIEIHQKSFRDSHHLKTIKFSDDSELQIISQEAFYNSSIVELEIPSSVIELEKQWCESTCFLNHISLKPNNKRYIYFDNQFILGKSDQNRHNYDILVFARRDINIVIIPSFIKIIDHYAFEFCEEIEKVEFSQNSELQIIGRSAFSSSSIESIIIPKHVKKIKNFAFCECKYLEEVQFEQNSELQTIGYSVFETDPVYNILIPSEVKIIKNCAFANCYELTIFKFEENSKLETIESNAFAFTPIESISIPSEIVELKHGWCRETFFLKNVLLNPNNRRYTYYNQLLIGKSDLNSDSFDVLVFVPRNIKFVTVPSFIKKIGPYAFDRCNSVFKIDFSINSQLEFIDSCGFASTSFDNIIIPDSVEEIGYRAFSDCKNLRSVIFSDKSKLKKINKAVFFVSALTSFEIPPNVTEIGSESFSRCADLQIIQIAENSKLSSFDRKILNDNVKPIILMIPNN